MARIFIEDLDEALSISGDDLLLVLPKSGTRLKKVKAGNVIAPGAINFFALSNAPAGWLKCNGQAVSRTTYAALFAAIGTTYGAGNGTSTFNVPEDRGEFLRGWDDGRGIDAGRTLGSFQAQNIQAHNHTFLLGAPGGTGYAPSGSNDVSAGSQATGNTGSTETRPRNRAYLICIKF